MGKNKAKNQKRKKKQKKKQAAKKQKARESKGEMSSLLAGDLFELRRQETEALIAPMQRIEPTSVPEKVEQLEALARLGFIFYDDTEKGECVLVDDLPLVIDVCANFDDAYKVALQMVEDSVRWDAFLGGEEDRFNDVRCVLSEGVFEELVKKDLVYLLEEYYDTSTGIDDILDYRSGLRQALEVLSQPALDAQKWEALGSVSGLDDPLVLTDAEQEMLAAIPVSEGLGVDALEEAARGVVEARKELAPNKQERLQKYLRNFVLVEHVFQMEKEGMSAS